MIVSLTSSADFMVTVTRALPSPAMSPIIIPAIARTLGGTILICSDLGFLGLISVATPLVYSMAASP